MCPEIECRLKGKKRALAWQREEKILLQGTREDKALWKIQQKGKRSHNSTWQLCSSWLCWASLCSSWLLSRGWPQRCLGSLKGEEGDAVSEFTVAVCHRAPCLTYSSVRIHWHCVGCVDGSLFPTFVFHREVLICLGLLHLKFRKLACVNILYEWAVHVEMNAMVEIRVSK